VDRPRAPASGRPHRARAPDRDRDRRSACPDQRRRHPLDVPHRADAARLSLSAVGRRPRRVARRPAH